MTCENCSNNYPEIEGPCDCLVESRIEDFNTDSDLHLCDSCVLDFPTCPGKVAIWGNGKGNDNVVACLSYKPERVRNTIMRVKDIKVEGGCSLVLDEDSNLLLVPSCLLGTY